ncbi:MAG: transcription elongation factor GreB [Pseudomonadota bacterium]
MARWKPPTPKSSPYITPAGYATLHKELDNLWVKRAEVTEAVSAAAAEGDRSENAEYIYRKKQLREMDSRIRYLQKRLPELNVVDVVGDPDTVRFGARVELERDDGQRLPYRIVGADEIDAKGDKISIDSPMARALIARRVDDEVEIAVSGQITHYLIVDITYDSTKP